MNINKQNGFTLIELLIALVIGMILMAGLYSNFILQSQVQKNQASKSVTAEDLQIAAQIMQRELRMAQTITLAGTRLQYTDVDGNSGSFWYNHGAPLINGTICWDQPPGNGACVTAEEMIRGLDTATGMTVTTVGSVFTITLTGTYIDMRDKQDTTFDLVFSVARRN
ncbi:MAG: prepilin-type N-terminal cleavage/methylation domain-containing protein [Mariprofundaceae bacterium]